MGDPDMRGSARRMLWALGPEELERLLLRRFAESRSSEAEHWRGNPLQTWSDCRSASSGTGSPGHSIDAVLQSQN